LKAAVACDQSPIDAMTIRIANTDFDRIDYDADADVLYLAADDPARGGRIRRDAGGPRGPLRGKR
jgi:hypothetical protein